MRNYTEIESRQMFDRLCNGSCDTLSHLAFQDITFYPADDCRHYCDCIFIGCQIPEQMRRVIAPDCIELPRLPVPYNIFPSMLYTPEQLYDGYNPSDEASFENCYDTRVWHHYTSEGRIAGNILETLARSLHDHSITDALYDLLGDWDERHIVAVMGGHSLARTDESYRKIAVISRALTQSGLLVVSGGGPGAMEATHLGAWMAGRSIEELDAAIEILREAPRYTDKGWLAAAFRVRDLWPQTEGYRSVGVPTWFYGHEPATPLATHIAKYFDNSIREDGLLTIAKGGVIYAPGSAGTLQEIFQDAAQNHYVTHGVSSPMVFLGEEYWREQVPVYPLLEELMCRGRYKGLRLTITDSTDTAAETLLDFAHYSSR
ncbi:MAG: hypothetical protein IJ014_05655 [Rikenellaceae bacterium]|nr:hypothetical protein [Rikenellaceae bacterium]